MYIFFGNSDDWYKQNVCLKRVNIYVIFLITLYYIYMDTNSTLGSILAFYLIASKSTILNSSAIYAGGLS